MPNHRFNLPDDLEEATRPKARIIAERYRVCEVCGQEFDTHDLDQTYHHSPEPHGPKP